MSFSRDVLRFVGVLALSVSVAFADTCTLYFYNSVGYLTPDEAGAAAAAVREADEAEDCTSTATSCESGFSAVNCEVTTSSWNCDAQFSRTDGPATGNWCSTHTCGTVTTSNTFSGSRGSGECPPDECDAKIGQQQHMSTLDYVAAGGSGACLGGCALTAVPLSSMVIGGSGAYQNVMYAEYTGMTCAEEDARGGKCASSAGEVVCSSEPEKNCGTVNGDEVCIDAVSEENPCVSFESGAVACLASVPDAQPDNGTEGEAAEPTAQVKEGDTTVNYYSSSVVSNSSTPVVSDPADEDSGDGDGDGEGEGEEGDECVPGEECAGDLPDQGSAGNCDDFTACFSSFFGRVQNAPIVDAVSGVSAAFPTGSCPSWNLEAFGETYALSAPMCSIWEDVAPILSAAFLFIWGWVATRIFLSA